MSPKYKNLLYLFLLPVAYLLTQVAGSKNIALASCNHLALEEVPVNALPATPAPEREQLHPFWAKYHCDLELPYLSILIEDKKIVQVQSLDVTPGAVRLSDTDTNFSPLLVHHPGRRPSFCISGKLITEAGQGIEAAEVTLEHSGCTPDCSAPSSTYSSDSGKFGFCNICEGCNTYKVTPVLDTDPLNGVNTFDLVLISRHILGLEPLNSPYKIISADANKSGTVTTFDIVELRKLILGTYQQLPNNDSWRFVDEAQVFTDNENPFANPIQSTTSISSTALPANETNFIGCKIGDMDLSAISNNRPAELPDAYISWDVSAAKNDQTFQVPVVYSGDKPVIALQFGLQFNPALMTLVGPSAGEVPGMNALFFGLDRANEGLIRFSWNVMDLEQTPVAPGTVLFYLTFERVADPGMQPALVLEEAVTSAYAWETDGALYRLKAGGAASERNAAPAANILHAALQPNPTSGPTMLQLTSPESGKMRLALMNAYGQRIALRDVPVVKGVQAVALNETDRLPAGIYQWWIRTPDGSTAQGQLIVR